MLHFQVCILFGSYYVCLVLTMCESVSTLLATIYL